MEFIRFLLKIIIVLKICVPHVYSQDSIINPYAVRSPFTLIPEDKHESKEIESGAGEHADLDQDTTPPIQYTNGEEDYSVKPIHYKYKIRPIFDPEDDEVEDDDNGDGSGFSGTSTTNRFTVPSSADVLVECVQTTRIIVLNSVLINIDTTSVLVIPTKDGKDNPATPIKIKSHIFDESNQEYVIVLNEDLKAGEFYYIGFNYVAKVFRDRLTGIYLSNYTEPSTNETRYLVATHFEPKDARQAFPSFDYPDQKATFEISLGRRAKYNTLGNMEIYKTEPIHGLDGWYWDHYNTTAVPMSTYLVALVVSEFTSETSDPALFNGKPVKIWAPKHQIDAHGGVLGAQVAAKILEFYENYFDIEYPMPKMDSASIPHFGAGAMENWGLNLYRPPYLLHYPGKSSERERLDVTATIGHELAHQWFGDLVTCRTWSQIYLNEGFASYVENLGVQSVSPEFEIWNMFSTNKLQVALLNDQLPETSHPIVNDSNPDIGLFDRITYSKGSSVIKMMEDFLGENVLQAGLRAYLKKLALGNTHQNDLYTILNEVALQHDPTLANSYTTLGAIMDTWTLQKGYPLIRVKMVDEGLFLTQEPFDYSEKPAPATTTITTLPNNGTHKGDRDGSDDDEKQVQRWWIPIKVATDKKESELFWISSTSSIRKYYDLDIANQKWVVVNPHARGVYRVLYDDELYARIQQQLVQDHSVVSPSARAQFIDDYFTLAFSDYIHINNALDFTLYLGEETEYNVWATTYSNFRRTLRLFGKTDAYDKLQAYLTTRVNSALVKIGYEQKPNEKGTKVLARSHLLGFAIVLEDQISMEYAEEVFDAWVQDPVNNKIPADLQAAILCGSIKVKGEDAWSSVYQFYLAESADPTTSPTRKQALLAAISCTKDKNLLTRLLHEIMHPVSLTSAGYDKTSVKRIYENFASTSPAAREVLVDFLYEKTYDMNRIGGHIGDSHRDHQRINGVNRKHNPVNHDIPTVDIVTTLSYYLHSPVDLRQMENLVNTYNEGMKLGNVDSTIMEKNKKRFSKSVQRIRDNHEWLHKFYDLINSWLQDHINYQIRL